jgi:hypothetical protein
LARRAVEKVLGDSEEREVGRQLPVEEGMEGMVYGGYGEYGGYEGYG